MKRLGLPVVLIAFLLAAPVAAIGAQSNLSWHVGGGVLMPMGDFNTYAKPGYLGHAGVGGALGSNPKCSWDATVFYGHASHDDVAGDATNIPGVAGSVNYLLGSGTGKVMPYVSGMVGVMQHRFSAGPSSSAEDAETKVVFGVGAGLSKPAGSGAVFLDARYAIADGTNFVPITVGYSWGGKKK
jgi:hypothetical protein